MASVIDDLKAQARILQREDRAGNRAALARIGGTPEGDVPDHEITRTRCLGVIARELGFEGWPHALALFEGREVSDHGTLLYAPDCAAHWNIWLASYDEAREVHAEHGGTLLAYRRQFLVVEDHFLATLGVDPADPDWELLGRDWVRPRSVEARARLYGKIIRARQERLAA